MWSQFLHNGNCLHFSDCHGDGLVSAQLQLPPHGAHLNEEAHDVIPRSVSVKSLLRLPVLDQVEGVGVYLPQQLIVDKARTFLRATIMTYAT